MVTLHRLLLLNLIFFLYGLVSLKVSNSDVLLNEDGLAKPFLPAIVDSWHGRSLALTSEEIGENYKGTALRKIYEKENTSIGVLILREENGNRGFHSPVNCFTANGWSVGSQKTVELKISGMDHSVHLLRLELSRGTQRIVSYHSILYDRFSYDSFIVFMMYRALNILSGNYKPATLIRFTTSIDESGPQMADERIQRFAGHFMRTTFKADFSVRSTKENMPLASNTLKTNTWNNTCLDIQRM